MVRAVAEASRICRRVQRDLVLARTVEKTDRSPVTVADFASQAIVSSILSDHLPDVPLVGEENADLLRQEENGAVLNAILAQLSDAMEASKAQVLDAIDRGRANPGSSARFFTLDPIDGTKGFLRGEQYAVALALVEDGVVTAGVLGCPNLPTPSGGRGSIFVAARGQGAFALSGEIGAPELESVRVSTEADPTRARFCQSVEKAHTHKGRATLVAELLGVTAKPVGMDSQCKYALLGRGDAELYLRIPRDETYQEKIWDHAAGLILVEEAGGRVTDIHGRPLEFTHGRTLAKNRGVVASNGPIHDAVIEALAKTE